MTDKNPQTDEDRAYLATLLTRIEAASAHHEDDDAALVIMSGMLTELAGANVEALGFGAIDGRPVPLVVMASSAVAADVAAAALSAVGLHRVGAKVQPADLELEPAFPDGQWLSWYERVAVVEQAA